MEDFGNIVYVLAAIAWFAWNTYKKSQSGKRKPAGASQPGRAQEQKQTKVSEEKSFEELIMEQFGEKQPEPVMRDIQTDSNQDKFLNTDLTHSHLADDYKMSESEMKSHRVERQVRKLEVEEEKAESMIDTLLPDGFNLRQAVVLNAILERPYN